MLICPVDYLLFFSVYVLNTIREGDFIMYAKPFLKWAGGKTQLLNIIRNNYPQDKTKYAEPFVGGGAVLFDVLQNCKMKEVYISDSNPKLVYAYQAIRDSVQLLISILDEIQRQFEEATDKKQFYLEQRQAFNETSSGIRMAALMIFLNKTCFNGLYRVNKKGEFNVPFANPANPQIYNVENLLRISELLQPVQIVCGDFSEAGRFIDFDTFVYIDPPYRPLSHTSNFTSYSNQGFSDKEQIRLASFVRRMSQTGAKIIVSNSDPHNINQSDNFFDDLYDGFNISRVYARRNINRDGSKRKEISELLIKNF